MENQMVEKRAYRRYQRELTCRFKDLDSDNPTSFCETVTTDISEGGLRFRTSWFIPMNHRVSFSIEIPKHPKIEAVVKPVWSHELESVEQFDMGALFVVLSPSDRAVLKDFIYS